MAYLRCSTDRQAEEGLGLDVQRQAIDGWAKSTGHRIIGRFADEGVSGSNGIEHRRALGDALEVVSDNRAAGLVVYRLDRLARDLIIQETLLAQVRRLGGEVFSTSPAEAGYLNDDPDDPSRKLIRQVLGAVSEYERSMINLRLRAGRRRKAEQGRYTFGSPPLGYRVEGKELAPHDEEQVILRRIVELHRQGASVRAIAAALTEAGYRTKRGTTTWHPTTVARILARERRR